MCAEGGGVCWGGGGGTVGSGSALIRPEHCDGERRQGVQAAEPAHGGRPRRAAVRGVRRAPGSAGDTTTSRQHFDGRRGRIYRQGRRSRRQVRQGEPKDFPGRTAAQSVEPPAAPSWRPWRPWRFNLPGFGAGKPRMPPVARAAAAMRSSRPKERARGLVATVSGAVLQPPASSLRTSNRERSTSGSRNHRTIHARRP